MRLQRKLQGGRREACLFFSHVNHNWQWLRCNLHVSFHAGPSGAAAGAGSGAGSGAARPAPRGLQGVAPPKRHYGKIDVRGIEQVRAGDCSAGLLFSAGPGSAYTNASLKALQPRSKGLVVRHDARALLRRNQQASPFKNPTCKLCAPTRGAAFKRAATTGHGAVRNSGRATHCL